MLPLFVALIMLRLSGEGAAPAGGPMAGGRLVVIVTRSRPLSDISLAELRRIYLGGTTRWPDGHRVVPIVLPADTAEQRCFLRRVVDMADIDYVHVWIGQVFRGRAAAPPVVARSSVAARQFVADDPNAIAVINAADVNETVRVLTVDGRTRFAPDYPLRW